MFAVLTTPEVVAVVDSNDRHRWAMFGAGSDESARNWAEYLNQGSRTRDELAWSLMSDHEYRADLGAVDPRIAELTATVERLQSRVAQLSGQVSGDDERLTEFWERAHRIATAADYCEVFDRMCDELGGPRRTVEVDVTITLTHTFSATMSRADYDNGDWSDIDPGDYVDRYSINLSDAEIESVDLI